MIVTSVKPAGAARRRVSRLGRVWTGFLWLLVAGLAAWALVRGTGFDRRTPLAQLISYTPYVGVWAAAVLVAALATKRWRAGVAAGTLVVIFAAFVLPRAVPGGDPPDGERLRVMTFNTKIGAGSVDEIMTLLRRERPDVLSVAELTPGWAARLEGAGVGQLLPHSALRADDGAVGTGLWARYPLTDARRMDPASAGFDQTFAVLRRPGKPAVEVGSAHPRPPLPRAQPWGSSHRWAGDIDGLPKATGSGPIRVLAGDFNATLDHSPLRTLIKTGYRDAAADVGRGLVPTWPEDRNRFPPVSIASLVPPVTIDHVLVDDRAGVGAYRTHRVAGTDHRAIVADLVLPE